MEKKLWLQRQFSKWNCVCVCVWGEWGGEGGGGVCMHVCVPSQHFGTKTPGKKIQCSHHADSQKALPLVMTSNMSDFESMPRHPWASSVDSPASLPVTRELPNHPRRGKWHTHSHPRHGNSLLWHRHRTATRLAKKPFIVRGLRCVIKQYFSWRFTRRGVRNRMNVVMAEYSLWIGAMLQTWSNYERPEGSPELFYCPRCAHRMFNVCTIVVHR